MVAALLQEEEKALVKGSSDFLGLNHYSTDIAKDNAEGDFVSHWGTTAKGDHITSSYMLIVICSISLGDYATCCLCGGKRVGGMLQYK
jgi:hypothetical protein